MKVVILAGGLGTRISEESHLKPKPMVEIGERPVLWHIMKCYSKFGFYDFVICCGYKSYVIKEYFYNYHLHTSDITFNFADENHMEIHKSKTEPWKVTLVDTGRNTETAGRIGRVREYIKDQTFMLTYGDGLSDIDIPALVKHHKASGKKATLTAILPEGRFGALEISQEGLVNRFVEKPPGDNAWINGGFMVMEPEVLKMIKGDKTDLQGEVLPALAAEGELTAYYHHGFWHAMDTIRDKEKLEALWDSGNAPWM